MRDALREQALSAAVGDKHGDVRVHEATGDDKVIVTMTRDQLDRLIDYDVTPHHEPKVEDAAWAAD